jgi:alkylhydroperoxidase/carboxymuconolactone decarboxylase family protein YurZ
MSNTRHGRWAIFGFAVAATITLGLSYPAASAAAGPESPPSSSASTLSGKQQSIAPIAAAMAVGDMARLDAALNRGLDAGLTVSEVKEVLVQLYAYAGFPRSLNALGELMRVLEARRQRGRHDPAGRDPEAIPDGRELLVVGTANQTKLIGAPVKGPLFDFAPAIDDFLKRHLFGAIFARDNLDWQSRELATVGALAALAGVESQLLSHVGVSMNVGLTASQLGQLAETLAAEGHADAAARTRAALERHLAGRAR